MKAVATFTPLPHSATPSSQSRLQHHSAVLACWHLLSLDAPCVAILWTWFIARSSRIHLGVEPLLSMGLAVWVLYAADRLLDARTSQHLEHRHFFHRQHAAAFRLGIFVAATALAFLIPHLPLESLRLYAILGSLVAAYFLLIHTQPNLAPRLPKEIAVGIFFSAATFIPTIAKSPFLRPSLLPEAVLLGLLCALNCLFIYAWEHPAPYPLAHPTTRLALRSLVPFASATALLASVLVLLNSTSPQLPISIALAAALLVLLHSCRSRLNPTTLRAAADLCLLVPLFFALTLPA